MHRAVQEKIASKRTTLVEESELTHVAAPDNPTKEFENRLVANNRQSPADLFRS